jgi:hypothetical protein
MDPTFEALFALLPPEYVTYVYTALAAVGALSVILAAAKPFLAKLPPGARVWVDGLIAVLDYVAVNTKPLHDKPWPKPKAEKKK